MDWNRIEGNWKQFKGQAKEKWGRLTEDDLDVINGRQEQLEGKIQERYGLAKDQAKKDVDACHCRDHPVPSGNQTAWSARTNWN